VTGSFGPDLQRRRVIAIDLPEFLILALESRVEEANDGVVPAELCTLGQYIESELVNLVTLRDIAELETRRPGFAEAVHQWIIEMRG
jgi:hypothetical protein